MNKALKHLIDMGKTQKTIEMYGKKWTLHTLDAQSQLKATNATGDYDNLSRVMALKVAILSYAIDNIDGESLGNESEARELLSQLQVPLINRLYNEYDKLVEKQDYDLQALDNQQDSISTNDNADEPNTKAI